MDFSALFKRAGKAVAENSPVILTALATTGVLTTAILAAKGAFKASEILKYASASKYTNAQVNEDGSIKADVSPRVKSQEQLASEELTAREMFDLTWKCYVPAAVTAALTVAAIVSVNHIGERRAAAMASAYSISEKAFKEYQEKTKKKVGKAKEQAIRDEIAQDRIDSNEIKRSQVFVSGRGTTLCYDAWSGRYFDSDIETIRKAVNDFNARVISDLYASLSDFWELIGLPPTTESDAVGWDTDKLLSIYTSFATYKGDPCLEIEFENRPVSLLKTRM